MNKIIMSKKNSPNKDKRKNRKPKRRVTNHELQEKVDELVSLLFEEKKRTEISRERKKD